jgi:hypothetical protein
MTPTYNHSSCTHLKLSIVNCQFEIAFDRCYHGDG